MIAFRQMRNSAIWLVRLAPVTQPCCSITPTSTMNNHNTSPILLTSLTQINQKMPYSSQSPADNTHEKPHMYQLEHVQKRLEFTVPLMFNTRLDYTFYRNDVILEDQIQGVTKHGLLEMRNHMATISLVLRIFRPYVEAEIINIAPILEDGTVRLRWRVIYLTWLQILNPKNFKEETGKKNLKWYDGYSIFYVDGEGLVYKCTLQKTMPDDSVLSPIKEKTTGFVRRVVMPSPEPTNNYTRRTSTVRDGYVKYKKGDEEKKGGGDITKGKLRNIC